MTKSTLTIHSSQIGKPAHDVTAYEFTSAMPLASSGSAPSPILVAYEHVEVIVKARTTEGTPQLELSSSKR